MSIACIVGLLIWLFPIVYWRFFKIAQGADVKFSFEPAHEKPNTLIVHFPGFIGDGLEQIRNVLPTVLSHGDLLPVHYDGDHGKEAQCFDPKLVVRESIGKIEEYVRRNGYANVVILGTSFGAKIGLRVAQGLKRRGARTQGVLVDPPWSWLDLQLPQKFLAPLLWVLLFVPVLNWIYVIPLARRIIMGMVAPGPQEHEIDNDLTSDQRQALDDSVIEARKTRLLFCRDQVQAILMPLRGSFVRVWGPGDVVIIRSGGDTDVVKPRAHTSWKRALRIPNLKLITLSTAKHAGYGQNPAEEGWGLSEAFAYLGVR